jgi:putative adhesin/SHOCT-like protein
MQDERSMILNMLKEGKISVEEAEALLEVLAEGETGEPGGFAAAGSQDNGARENAHGSGGEGTGDTGHSRASREERTKSRSHDNGKDPHTVIFTVDASDEDDHDGGDAGSGTKPGGFGFDFDFGGLKDSLRDTMKGVSAAVKDVMGELSELDLGNEIFRAMGKIRAEASDVVTVSSGGAASLSISNKWGDVRVTGDDSDSDTITVRTKASSWGRSQDDADEALGKVNVRLEQGGDTWTVKSGLEGASPGRVRIDYEITLPRSMGVSVSSLSGDIWIEELDGEQSITTLSGDITIADLGLDNGSGQVMKTKSGDIVGGALTGDISLSSLSGDVEINGFTGNLQVTTQSGDVTIQDGAGSVQVKTMSGDIEAALRDLGAKPVTVSSVSGDVELQIPADSAVDVAAKSTSGDIGVDLDLEFETQTERLVVGKMHGGGIEVTATTVSGDISVSD